MTRGVVIALGVAAAVLAVIVFKMTRQSSGLAGGVPYYTPGAPNSIGGPPLPASNKLSTFLQGVTGTAKAAADTVDALGTLWEKTGGSWSNSDDENESFTAAYVDSLPNIQS